MEMTEDEYAVYLDERMNAIETREDLADYLYELSEAYRSGFIEQQSVFDYVSGGAAFTMALDGFCKNHKLECPDQPDWRWAGQIFTSAFYHS